MPTLRFEGTSLDEAVRAARGQVGPVGRIVGASRVRRGGMAGFFAREHIEVEVEVAGVLPARRPASPASEKPSRASRGPGERPTGPSPEQGRALTGTRSAAGDRPPASRDQAPDDPLSALIEEMAESGPSSVLDLAEKVNAEQNHYALAPEKPATGTGLPAQAVPAPRANPMPQARPAPAPARAPGATDLRDTLAVQLRKPSGTPGAPAAAAQPRLGQPMPKNVIDRPVPAPVPRPAAAGAPGRAGPDFADVLERIAKQAGLFEARQARDPHPEARGPEARSPEQGGTDVWVAPAQALTPVPAPVNHASAILSELEGRLGCEGRLGPQTGPPVAGPRPPGPAPERAAAGEVLAPARRPELGPDREISGFGLALQGLGVPLPACQAVLPATTREDLEVELRRALSRALPPLPTMPTSAAGVVAVVGPREQVMATAKLIAAEVGAPANEITLATERKVWRQSEHVVPSPEAAAESRKSWRWRGHPSVVAIEAPVRPNVTSWMGEMLRALEPTLCWGVAEASHKPEDLVAWSQALGGLDVLALVDLDGTTTPAAALTTALPVGQLDGKPATAEVWAKVLCSRLTG